MPATLAHTDTALAVARETGWDLDGYAEDHGWSGVGLGPVGQHRDSEALDRSNFEVISEDLEEKFGEAIDTAGFGHWAVGWVEEIAWDAGREDVRKAVEAWRDALADYPVADDDHHSTLEHEEACETIENVARSWVERDGIEYELRDDRPDTWVTDVFSWLFDTYSYCRSEEIGEDDVTEALFALDMYKREGEN